MNTMMIRTPDGHLTPDGYGVVTATPEELAAFDLGWQEGVRAAKTHAGRALDHLALLGELQAGPGAFEDDPA